MGISVIYESNNVNVEITEELDSDENNSEHPNIRALVKRMDLLLENSDYSGVLHTSASIFETLAKTVLNRINLEDKTLGSFFDAYKNKSHLPEPILDMIKNIYSKRNTEPLAGHGSTSIPSVTKKDAIVIVEMTKAFIKMERKLAEPELTSV